MKPHPSFFLKVMFNFLSLQHYTPYVMGVGWGKSLPRWLDLTVFFLKGSSQMYFYVV